MKHTFDEHQIDLAAKNLINRFELEHKEEVQPQAEKTYFTDIKVAKAKAGARRHINRTIRVCTVAAVLMIGLVCALFMGAEDDDKPMEIYIEKQGYMWKNNDPEAAENMPVTVTIDFKEYDKSTQATLPYSDKDMSIAEAEQKYGWKWNGTEWESGVKLKGDIVIKDIDGNIISEYTNVIIITNYNDDSGRLWLHNDTFPWVEHKNTGEYAPMCSISIVFNEDYTEFEITKFITRCDFEDDLGLEGSDGLKGPVWAHKDAIFIDSGATNREEALKLKYEWAQRKVDWDLENNITSGHTDTQILNKAWK